MIRDIWPGNSCDIEDLILWGIDPLQTLNEIRGALDGAMYKPRKPVEIDDAVIDDVVGLFYHEIYRRTADVKIVLNRFGIYLDLLEKRLKELSPDDPLLKDTQTIIEKEEQDRARG